MLHDAPKTRPPGRLRFAVLAALVAVSTGCQQTRVTPPVSIDLLHAVADARGIDITFVLRDKDKRPTVMLLGESVLKIEDMRPEDANFSLYDTVEVLRNDPADWATPDNPDSIVLPLPDSTRVMYNRRMFISRDLFIRERVATEDGPADLDVCHLGVFPYDQLLRRPRHRNGIVRVAVIGIGGNAL